MIKKKYLFIAFAMITGLIGGIVGLFITGGSGDAILFLLSTLTVLMLFLAVINNKQYSLFEPLTFIILSFLMGSYFKYFYLFLNINNEIVSTKLLLGLDISTLYYGSLLVFVSFLFFSIGYSIRFPRFPILSSIKYYQSSYSRVLLFSGIFILLSLLSFGLLVTSLDVSFNSLSDLSAKRFQSGEETSASRLNAGTYYYYRLSLLAKGPMYILFYYKLLNNKPWRSVIGVFLAISIFINMFVPFFVSNKAGMILPIADLLVMTYIIKGKVNFKKIFLLVIICAGLISLAASIRGGDSVSNHSIYDKIFGGRYFIDITKTAHIISAVPDKIDYLHGLTFISWINPFLPESNKFPLDVSPSGLGFYIGGEVFGNPYSGVPPGIIAELYMNFGLMGVIFGMFITGVLLKSIHRSLARHWSSSSLVIIIYAIVIVRLPIFLFNNGIGVTLLKVIADLLIVGLFMLMVKKYKKGMWFDKK